MSKEKFERVKLPIPAANVPRAEWVSSPVSLNMDGDGTPGHGASHWSDHHASDLARVAD